MKSNFMFFIFILLATAQVSQAQVLSAIGPSLDRSPNFEYTAHILTTYFERTYKYASDQTKQDTPYMSFSLDVSTPSEQNLDGFTIFIFDTTTETSRTSSLQIDVALPGYGGSLQKVEQLKLMVQQAINRAGLQFPVSDPFLRKGRYYVGVGPENMPVSSPRLNHQLALFVEAMHYIGQDIKQHGIGFVLETRNSCLGLF